jgi:hypothetical protein
MSSQYLSDANRIIEISTSHYNTDKVKVYIQPKIKPKVSNGKNSKTTDEGF